MSSYPKTGDAGGSGRVATGVRIGFASSGPTGKVAPGLRLQVTLPQTGTIPSWGIWYEIFYDVYLKDAAGGWQYEFRYFYREVRWSSPGPMAPPGTNGWGAVGDAREIPTPAGPPTPTQSIPAGTKIPALGVSLPRALPIRGSGYPVGTSPNGGVSPQDFGWTGVGGGTGSGTPGRGPGGATPFPTTNPFGYDNNPSTGGGAQTTPDGTSTTDDETTEEDKDVGFSPPKKRKLRTNPPLISTATGAYVGVSVDGAFDPTEPTSRNDILGSGTIWQRRMRKGLIRQYIINENEWKITGGTGSVTTQYDKKGKPKKTDSWDADASVLDPKIEYGFRFHYNPSEIGFGTMPVEGLDPALLLSGKDKAYPVAAEGASVSFNLYLNRIEDMSLLKKTGSNTVKSWRSLYAGRELPQEDLQGILKRGTGYDLEFLFRTALGRPWVTQLRGATADLGVVVGLPMMLSLGGGMRYTGRLTGLQYTHNSFTQDMVPMFTSVSITFTRMPDSVQYSQSGNG